MNVYEEIRAERERQDEKWGKQNHTPMEWLPIIMEEVGEASKHALEGHFLSSSDYSQHLSYQQYRKELIHIAVAAINAMESYDRKGK